MFDNIHSQVFESELVLEGIQSEMDLRDLSKDLLQKESEAIVSLREALVVQKQFWA